MRKPLAATVRRGRTTVSEDDGYKVDNSGFAGLVLVEEASSHHHSGPLKLAFLNTVSSMASEEFALRHCRSAGDLFDSKPKPIEVRWAAIRLGNDTTD